MHSAPTLVRPSGEWGDSVSTRGFWFAEQDGYRATDGLSNFMETHRPVVVSLGSQRPSDEAGSNQTILEVAQDLGVPLLVVKGTSEFSVDQSARVRVVEDVPFEWLLPQASAVVHAGGAGVAHHALAAGVPQVALPIHGEQVMWSQRLAQRGVSPAPVMMRQLTHSKFRAALSDALGSTRIARSVEACALAIRSEDGVDGAVRDLTEWANASRDR
jgi:sterol 3beta-glucosyltransferase